MTTSVRLDEETERILNDTAKVLNTTKSEVVKRSIREFCQKSLAEKTKKPYELIADLIGNEFSGQGNLSIDGEKILREAFRKRHDSD